MASPLVVDSNNTAHILFSELTKESYNVVYASQNGSGWSKQTIAIGAAASSLVLDSDGNPHILYYQIDNQDP
jgi:hypothetical protein